MSEYQYVHFMALDKPVTEKELDFMERQSSRAEITPWEFTNEYNFGDFRGNAVEMLRRGYDVHLHFANFGIRKLMIRLPAGPPCDNRTFKSFFAENGMEWIADKSGKGGILSIEPGEGDEFFDYVEDVDTLLPKISPVRNMLIEGDLRPLYLAWLACRSGVEDDAMEPPVPAGLEKMPAALKTVAQFYLIDMDLIAAAADRSPPLAEASRKNDSKKEWLAKQSENKLRELAEKLLSEEGQSVRVETLSRIREESGKPSWQLEKPTRTLAQLLELSKEARNTRRRKEELSKEAARRKRLKDIVADPRKLVANVEKLVKMRSSEDYQKAARELTDLREALGPEHGPAQARAVAEKLKRENPTLRMLISALKNKICWGNEAQRQTGYFMMPDAESDGCG